MSKQKGTAEGGMTYTEEQMKGIVKQAMDAVAELTAEKCRDEGVRNIIEYEQRLAKLQKEKEDAEQQWAERVRAMEVELASRKRAQGGASRIMQLEAKVQRLESENMAMECELGELLEMMSMNDTDDENED